MEEFKALVTEVLTPHASAILLDPEWGIPASKRRAKNAGLLMAYEKTGYDKTGPGRLPDLLDEWSRAPAERNRRRLHQDPALLHPLRPADVNDKKHAWAERIGDECRANDIPFFLELVGYEEGVDEKGFEFSKKKPEIVTRSMQEFTKDRYGVDVLKVEVPVNMKFVEGTRSFGGQKVHSKQEAMDAFRRAAEVSTRPFIYLSAGVSNAEFTESLELGAEAGDAVLRRAVRQGDVEGWHRRLRQAGRRGVSFVAPGSGRQEHRKRERPPEAGASVVRVLRREERGRAPLARMVNGKG